MPTTPRPVMVGAVALAALWSSGCASEGSAGADHGRAEEPNELTIIGVDYAFGGPHTLPPGPTAITFENRGQVEHEMILVRLKKGVTLDQVMEGVASGDDPTDFTEGGSGILIVGPGQTTASRLLVDMMPGRTYVLVCSLQSGPEGKPHLQLGMVSTLQVSEQ